MPMTLDNLAAQHRPMLLCYARALVGGDEHHAEDVVQESFLIAHRRRDDFREGEDFGRWLRGIARNKVLEGQRSSARQPIVDSRIVEGMDEVFALFDAGPTPDEPWRERLARLLKQCVDKLTPTLRDALMQVYRDGRSLRDAAAALASSPPAVAQRLSRARELIRECVQSRREAEA